MRRRLLGVLMVPAVAGLCLAASWGARVAAASPVEGRAVARLARAMEGRFVADPAASHASRRGALVRAACRVDAPGLGARAVYVEDRFEHADKPFSQRLFVLDPAGVDAARVREFVLSDPGAMRGACDEPSARTVARAEVTEREGCEASLTLRDGVFSGVTAGSRCASIVNGATHAKRTWRLDDASVTVHEQGFDEAGEVAWGRAAEPVRFTRQRP